MAKKKATKKTPKQSAKKSTRKTAGKKSVKKASAKSAKKSTAKKATSKASKNKSPSKAKSSKKAAAKKAPAKKASTKAKAGKKKSSRSSKLKSPLTKPQLKEFRELLLEKRRSLIGDMAGMTGAGRSMQDSAGDLSNMPTHPADIGSDNFEHEFTLGLLESERKMLDEINEALQRIEENTYGICMGTGEAIGLPRLKARPWCKYSIEYQRLIEKGLAKPRDEDNRFGADEADEIDEEDDDDLEDFGDVDDEDAGDFDYDDED